MRSAFNRRYRHRSRPAKAENSFFKKEGQETFFGETGNEHFFHPSISSPRSIQRKCEECGKGDQKIQRSEEKKEEEKVQKKDATGSTAPDKTAGNYIGSINGKGQPLPAEANHFFSSKMEYDFSDVRIHHDGEAAESASDIHAKAYTVGNDIVFNKGQYNVQSNEGKRLMAHELTHVMQQNEGAANPATVRRKSLANRCGNKSQFEMYNDTINGIEFVVGLVKTDKVNEVKTYKKKIEANIESMAARINSDNQLIKNANEQVKECYILDTSTRLATKNGNNILLIAPKFADEQTTAHEMGHALFMFMRDNKNNSLIDVKRAGRFQLKLAEIFGRLSSETIRTKAGDIAATNIVDPSVWGGLAAEHPAKDVDEFFASAKSAYQTNKKKFINTIEQQKRNANVFFACVELFKLLDDFFRKGELPDPAEKIDNEKGAAAMVAGIAATESYVATTGTSAIFQSLLNKTC